MIIAAIACLWLTAGAPVSDEDRTRAFALADRAETLRGEGDLQGAREALAQAYGLDPNPYFLFGHGRLAAEAGDCDEAVALMQQFIERYPEADAAGDARAEIERCGGAHGSAAAPTVKPERQPPRQPQPQPPDSDRDSARPWHRDPAGGALLGTGLAGIAVGVGLYAGARAERNESGDASTTDAFRRSVNRTRTLQTSGIAFLSVGGGLLVGAVIRYAVVARRGAGRARFDGQALTLRF